MRNVFFAAVAAVALTVPATAGDNVRGVTDNEIVIGTHTDLSGVTAMWGVNNTNAWRMVFDETNAEGGINGRKIKYIVEDSQYQVPRAVQASNKLLNRDNVFMMVSNGGTPMNNATHHARADRQGRAEHLPADRGTFDVLPAQPHEVRLRRVLLRHGAGWSEAVR
jgi:branched-chain amino acid transport system substrate-binding protein